jgi:hypothetical protein
LFATVEAANCATVWQAHCKEYTEFSDKLAILSPFMADP